MFAPKLIVCVVLQLRLRRLFALRRDFSGIAVVDGDAIIQSLAFHFVGSRLRAEFWKRLRSACASGCILQVAHMRAFSTSHSAHRILRIWLRSFLFHNSFAVYCASIPFGRILVTVTRHHFGYVTFTPSSVSVTSSPNSGSEVPACTPLRDAWVR